MSYATIEDEWKWSNHRSIASELTALDGIAFTKTRKLYTVHYVYNVENVNSMFYHRYNTIKYHFIYLVCIGFVFI